MLKYVIMQKQIKIPHSTYPLEASILAAGEFLAIDPAGEIWSVVTESPKFRITRAPSICLAGGIS